MYIVVIFIPEGFISRYKFKKQPYLSLIMLVALFTIIYIAQHVSLLCI